MPNAFVYSIISVILVSLISFVGLLTLTLSSAWGKKIAALLVSFSAGALLGDVFIHLLPELSEKQGINLRTSLFILATVVAFFIMEKFVHWHHHHGSEGEESTAHHLVFTNLVGDGIHNIIDGLIIGGAYLLDTKLGIATTLAVILHEIPQEFGDFGILIYAGLSKARALFYNLLSAITAIIGAVLALWVGASNDKILTILASLAIGSFLYIATADLLPETYKQKEHFFSHFAAFFLGIGIMFLLLLVG